MCCCRRFFLVWTAPCARFLHVFLLPLQSQDRRCSVRGRTGFYICVVLVPLGAQIFEAIKGRSIAMIGQLSSRCALAVRPWTLTWSLVLGAQVEIFYNLRKVCWFWPPLAAETDVLTLLGKIIFFWKPCGSQLIRFLYCWYLSRLGLITVFPISKVPIFSTSDRKGPTWIIGVRSIGLRSSHWVVLHYWRNESPWQTIQFLYPWLP